VRPRRRTRREGCQVGTVKGRQGEPTCRPSPTGSLALAASDMIHPHRRPAEALGRACTTTPPRSDHRCRKYCCLPKTGVWVKCPLVNVLYPAEWMAEAPFRIFDLPSWHRRDLPKLGRAYLCIQYHTFIIGRMVHPPHSSDPLLLSGGCHAEPRTASMEERCPTQPHRAGLRDSTKYLRRRCLQGKFK